jgi:hypothetical protein
MKLQEWATKNEQHIAKHAHARCVASNVPNQPDLFHLDDYVVSSVTGGTIWLVRRQPFTEAELSLRGTMRNWCCGQKLLELSLTKIGYSDFSRDCIEEYIMELEAEERE